MKICIPYPTASHGGPSVFAANLRQALEGRKMQVAHRWIDDCDLVLAIVGAPLLTLLSAKRRGVPIVQRLDGLYYRAISGYRSPWLNRRLWLTHRFFCDAIVFQSRYSQKLCNHFLGTKPVPTTVIHNGVSLERFKPETGKFNRTGPRVLLTSLTHYRLPSQISPVLLAFASLREVYRDLQLLVVGRLGLDLSGLQQRHLDVRWLGQVSHSEVPAIYGMADLFVTSEQRSNCPNVLLEAMASGLPVVCYDSGGNKELVGDEAGICVPVAGDGYGPLPALDSGYLVEACLAIFRDLDGYSRRARSRAESLFDLREMTAKYLEFFEAVIEQHTTD